MLSSAVRHEVSFWHGPDRLTGDLRLPRAPGPHPTLIVVGEPGRPERDHSAWLEGLAEARIASFTWDRPPASPAGGCGGRPVAHHAREVLSAVGRLAHLPDLDAGAVAVLGWGEGGWVAAQATTYSNCIGALILACTPLTRPSGPPGEGAHDPIPTLSAVTVPVLALFGEQDPLVPLEGSVRDVRTALGDAGHADHEVAVVRGGDHGLRVRAPHGLGPIVDGRHRFGDWPAGLTRLLAEWLDRRLRPDAVPAFPPPAQTVGRVPAPARPPATPARLPPPVPVRQVRRRVPR